MFDMKPRVMDLNRIDSSYGCGPYTEQVFVFAPGVICGFPMNSQNLHIVRLEGENCVEIKKVLTCENRESNIHSVVRDKRKEKRHGKEE